MAQSRENSLPIKSVYFLDRCACVEQSVETKPLASENCCILFFTPEAVPVILNAT